MSAAGERAAPAMARAPGNVFAGGTHDRVAVKRTDEAWVARALADEGTRITPLHGLRHMVHGGETPRPVLLPPSRAAALVAAADVLVLLGESEGRAVFAAALPETHADPASVLAVEDAAFRELRELGPLLSPEAGALLCQARALAHWHRQHRFCGVCGAPTRGSAAGHLRVCTDAACGRQHFPRTDAAIIVLVSRTTGGEEYCLLGHQRRWPGPMYSTLAGFVEPGESLEDTVRREVHEETGVRVYDVRYHSSQPWPFPASLMLGFTARSDDERVVRHDQELDDARWFTRAGIAGALRRGEIRLPGLVSIAWRLVEGWYDAAAGPGALAALRGGG